MSGPDDATPAGPRPGGFWTHVFFTSFVRPFVTLGLGLNVRDRDRLPVDGPAVVVANHNSHLDTLVLMSLFPRRLRTRLRPVAARDYFAKTKLREWFATRVLGAILIDRGGADRRTRDPLAPISSALAAGDVVILFPEGSRGTPEERSGFQTGVAHLAKRHPDVPTVPVFLHGLGKALPKGEAIFVPFFCDVFVGEPLAWTGDKRAYMEELATRVDALAAAVKFPAWD